jgi:hypothetical protein
MCSVSGSRSFGEFAGYPLPLSLLRFLVSSPVYWSMCACLLLRLGCELKEVLPLMVSCGGWWVAVCCVDGFFWAVFLCDLHVFYIAGRSSLAVYSGPAYAGPHIYEQNPIVWLFLT